MNNSHKRIAKLPFKTINHPEVETRMPLTCVHNDELYVSNLSSIHRYDETNDVWIKVIDYHISNMVSNDNGYMYVTDAVSNSLCRFRPGIDVKMEKILCCADNFDPIINVCAMGDQLLFFTNRTRSPENITGANDFERILSIHEYNLKSSLGSNAENSSSNFREVWCQESKHIKFDPYRSVLKLLLEEPYVDEFLTTYLENKLRVWKE
ncbi:hypothetical protein O0L34_g10760 [Tuta absoluta]|nr:hypothetical protein O0L34_g10760 [Tuta absoluta]